MNKIADQILELNQTAHYDFIAKPLRQHILNLPIPDGAKIYLITLWWGWVALPSKTVNERGEPRLRVSVSLSAKELNRSERTIQEYRAELEKIGYIQRTQNESVALKLPAPVMALLKGVTMSQRRPVKQNGANPTKNTTAKTNQGPSIAQREDGKDLSQEINKQGSLEALKAQRERIIEDLGGHLAYVQNPKYRQLDLLIDQIRDDNEKKKHNKAPSKAEAIQPTVHNKKGEVTLETSQPVGIEHVQIVVNTVHQLWSEKRISNPKEIIENIVHSLTSGWASKTFKSIKHRINVLLSLLKKGQYTLANSLNDIHQPLIAVANSLWDERSMGAGFRA